MNGERRDYRMDAVAYLLSMSTKYIILYGTLRKKDETKMLLGKFLNGTCINLIEIRSLFYYYIEALRILCLWCEGWGWSALILVSIKTMPDNFKCISGIQIRMAHTHSHALKSERQSGM